MACVGRQRACRIGESGLGLNHPPAEEREKGEAGRGRRRRRVAMLGRFRRGPTYANLAATIALILALGGGGFAVASHLEVRHSDIVRNAIRAKHIKKKPGDRKARPRGEPVRSRPRRPRGNVGFARAEQRKRGAQPAGDRDRHRRARGPGADDLQAGSIPRSLERGPGDLDTHVSGPGRPRVRCRCDRSLHDRRRSELVRVEYPGRGSRRGKVGPRGRECERHAKHPGDVRQAVR